MATVAKDFKVKNGLIVEGENGTINNYDILTKSQDSQDYIVDLVGGSGTSENTPNTLVLRDANGNFAAGTITANLTGEVSTLSNHDTDDLSEGTTNKYYTDARVKDVLTGATKTNITIETIAGELHITAENGVADSDTDDLTEGTTNKYFTEQRVWDSLEGGDGITFGATGTISADVAGGLHIDNAQVKIDRTTVDGWYDANGAAGDVAADLSTHEGLTSGVHGVTGSVVGTTDTQDLSNKTIIDTLSFSDGVTIAQEGEIAVLAVSHEFEIKANDGDLHLKTVATGADVNITSEDGDIVLNPDGAAYYGSVSAENEIATHGYVDNAVAGLDWKNAAHVLYNAATPTLTDTAPITIDGHLFGAGEDGLRVLVTSGNDGGSDAGIYVYNHGATWTLTRATDADAYTELLGAAIYIAEGTQFGATSWVQNNPYLTDFSAQSWTQFSGAGSVTAGTGIAVDGLEVSIDRATVDTWYDPAGEATSVVGTHAALTSTHGVNGDIVGTSDSQTLTNKTIDASSNTLSNIANSSLTNSSITVNGYATALGDTVTLDTDDVAEGTNQYFTTQRVKDVLTGSSQSNISITEVGGVLTIAAENGVDDSTTDDLEEGATNHYFTDDRAKDAAGYLLENSTQSNISISYNEGTRQLTVTAESGLADGTTDDLDEGTTNLYFTDQRAVDALEAVVPNFTEIDINSLATQVAATVSVPTASAVTAYAFPKADYRSAKFLVKTAYSTHTEIAEVLLTLDTGDNIAITEYAIVGTNGSSMTISADVDGANVRLRVTTLNSNSTVTVMGTLVA
jgi:molybdopterin-binding protein